MSKLIMSLIVGLGMLGGASTAYAVIKCEKCHCDLNTGVCDCTNCEIS